jgi:hypothetical protein
MFTKLFGAIVVVAIAIAIIAAGRVAMVPIAKAANELPKCGDATVLHQLEPLLLKSPIWQSLLVEPVVFSFAREDGMDGNKRVCVVNAAWHSSDNHDGTSTFQYTLQLTDDGQVYLIVPSQPGFRSPESSSFAH